MSEILKKRLSESGVRIAEAMPNGSKVSSSQLLTFNVIRMRLIKKVKVRWEPSIEFEDLLNEVTFEYVGTRKAQADARKAEKELLNNMATIQPGQEPDDDGTDDGGDDEGDVDLGA